MLILLQPTNFKDQRVKSREAMAKTVCQHALKRSLIISRLFFNATVVSRQTLVEQNSIVQKKV